MTPERTEAGKIAKFLFYELPLVWVEGPEDIPFYRELLPKGSCKFESAGGKEECKKLATAIRQNNYPFVVIMDGDYSILEHSRNPHRRTIILRRYSWENYLFNEYTICRVAADLARCDESDVKSLLDFSDIRLKIETHIRDLVELDISHQIQNTGIKVLPSNFQAIGKCTKGNFVFDAARIRKIVKDKRKGLPSQLLADVRGSINRFCEDSDFSFLVRGHFLITLCQLIVRHVSSICRKNCNAISNEGIQLLLISGLTSTSIQSLPEDLRNIRRMILAAIRESKRIRLIN